MVKKNESKVLSHFRISCTSMADSIKDFVLFNFSPDLEDDLKGHQKIVDTIKNTIWQTGLTNNNISSTLNTFNNNATMKIVVEHLNTSVKISDQMREVRRGAVDISSDVYKLKLKLTSLEPQWDTKLGMAEENGNFRSMKCLQFFRTLKWAL